MTTSKMVPVPKGYGAVQVRASTLNEADRTVEIIWAAGAQVKRWAPEIGEYIEELSMDPAHIRLERFQAGMSLLDAHAAASMDSRLGTVIVSSVHISGGKGFATVKLSRKRAAEELMQDLRDGHPFPVSVGYRTHEYVRVETEGALPVLRAVDWEPFELSAVPVPADGGAHSRAADGEGTECRVVSLPASQVARRVLARMKMRQATLMA
ncbi:hypothetical protein [Devosia naphthalenivorans]|uniref:hypothetical protein n=1 Tax=Devosia naphthalenivorans TaxID=2082392 RepID=UPI000D3D5535|nr:hypothetical protein [Devosia naphthalenivorans]